MFRVRAAVSRSAQSATDETAEAGEGMSGCRLSGRTTRTHKHRYTHLLDQLRFQRCVVDVLGVQNVVEEKGLGELRASSQPE